MATVVLGTIGGIVGAAFGPVGAIVGRAVGALAGSYLDQQIVNALTPPVRNEGPRLTTTDIQGSSESTVVGRGYGRTRLPGNIFWATRFLEEISEETTGGKGSSGPSTVTTEYVYFANFALGICEGPVAGFGRIWADGKEIEPGEYTIRYYRGDELQEADPLIEAKEENAPAYRGLAYLVFERMPIVSWGNRIPQFHVEVFRPTGALEELVSSVAIVAGNEFGFDTEEVKGGTGQDAQSLNRHTLLADTDFEASIDRLQMLCPNVGSVMLVIPWFGNDLRAGNCTVRPKVDNAGKVTSVNWQVAGLNRAGAQVVSEVNGIPAFGGTPNDASVIRAIQLCNARGLDVTLCPFIMMDIAAGNALPNPYSANAATPGQPVYPWRGRITCSPAAGFTGTIDKTATAAAQISSFLGTAAPGHFGGFGTTVTYAGPAEWSYRRFILHYARLAALAGGVEAFLIGTELVKLTRVRSSATAYPFVTGLKSLAADVSGMLPGAKLGYAADWSEWNNHHPDDGSNDLLFNLDPLWSDPNIDFVGIDNYLPLSDWRDGTGHLDFAASGPSSIYDRDYLASNVRGGEYFDWYYASDADRAAQIRSPITDGDPANEPWVWRQKDLLNWWQNEHRDRPAGVRAGVITGWTPGMKPIRFTELGCAAADKAANQPNVFPDPHSVEGGYPWFSSRARDDAMQRAYLEAMLGFYADPANNPGMVDLERTNLWCWDARPWPSFPLDTSWADAPNWETGHWLSGRLGAAPAAGTIATILDDVDFPEFVTEPIPAVVDGVTVGNITSARATLEALRPAFQFDAVESDGMIRLIARHGRMPVASIDAGELVVSEPENPKLWRATRGQETELPDAIKLRYGDPARDDQAASVEARRGAGSSARVIDYAPPVILAESAARQVAEIELHAAWHGRERSSFTLPPSRLALDAGDVVEFQPNGRTLKLEAVGDQLGRPAEAFQVDPLGYAPVALPRSSGRKAAAPTLLDPELVLIDGPLLADGDAGHAGYLAGLMSPFRSGLAVYRSPSSSGFSLDQVLTLPATIGETTGDFYPGPLWRWDRVNSLYLKLKRGALSSATEELVLNGANQLAIENADGEWEILQFATAAPNGARSYILTNLLRGQRGSEQAMRSPVASGARLVLLTGAVRQSTITPAETGLVLNWRAGAASEAVGSPGWDSFTTAIEGKGRRPLAPAHLRGSRDALSGDWNLSWIRRTRIGGDSWDQEEVPLGEDSEAYRLQILSGPGGAVLRTFDTSTAGQLYTAAEQATDFGVAQYSFTAKVAQLSATWGPGLFSEQLIWVR